MDIWFFLVWFLLLGCLGLQIDQAPSGIRRKIPKSSADEEDFLSNIQGFVQNFEKVKNQADGVIPKSGLTQTHLKQKDKGNELVVSAAGTDYIYGGGESERIENRPKSGTSEFKINTGFNVGLRWRPIRTKQKIKKLLFYFPKMFIRKTKSFIEKKILKSRDDPEVSDGGDYNDDFGYDDSQNDTDVNDEYDSDDTELGYESDMEGEGDSPEDDVYSMDSQDEPKAHRIKVYGRPSVSTQSLKSGKAKVMHDIKNAKKFSPQSMEFSSPLGSLITSTDPIIKATGNSIPEKKPTSHGYVNEVNDNNIHSSNKNFGSEKEGVSNSVEMIEKGKTSIQNQDTKSRIDVENAKAAQEEAQSHGEATIDEIDWEKELYGTIVDAEALEPLSEIEAGTGETNFIGESLALQSEDEEEPEYVLVDNSILVNEICPHMPNHFRSSKQVPGKTEDVLVTVFRQTPSSRLTRSRPQYEGSFFPTDHLFASSAQSSRIRLQDLIMWLLFAQLI